MYSYLWFLIAALGEIAGCYTFWMWLRESKSPLWLLPGFLSLALFAFALTRIDFCNRWQSLCRLRRNLYFVFPDLDGYSGKNKT